MTPPGTYIGLCHRAQREGWTVHLENDTAARPSRLSRLVLLDRQGEEIDNYRFPVGKKKTLDEAAAALLALVDYQPTED